MKKLKKMPVLTGRMPFVYSPFAFADAINLLNAHSNIINYLVKVIEAQEKKKSKYSRTWQRGKKNDDTSLQS